MPRRASRAFDFAAYVLFRILSAGICAIPITWSFRLGSGCGLIFHACAPKLRELARHNVRLAYRGEKSEPEICALVRESFRLLGANLVSAIKTGSMSPEELRRHVTVEASPGAAEAGKDKTRGWVAMISHMGNWEILARLGILVPGYPVGAIYRPVPNPHFDTYLRTTRARYGVTLFDRFKDLTKAPAFLRRGGVLGVLVDQYAGDLGLWVPFFGRLASTSTLAATYSLRARVPIIPLAVSTTGVAQWTITAFDPVDASSGEIAILTARMNQVLESQIRQNPADWLWCHHRWKTPRRFLLAESKRGIALAPGQRPEDLIPFRILVLSPTPVEEARAAASAVARIREGRPDVSLTVAANPSLNAVWTAVPGVDVVVPLPTPGKAGGNAGLSTQGEGFEAAFLFHSSDQNAFARSLQEHIPRIVTLPENLPDEQKRSPEVYLAAVAGVEA